LIIAYLLPAAIDTLFQLGKTPLEGVNISACFLVPSSLITAWLVFNNRLLNLEPIARSALLDHMQDGMVVLDAEGAIADLNPRAEQMLGLKLTGVRGQSCEAIPAKWRIFFEAETQPQRRSIREGEGEPFWIESSAVKLTDRQNSTIGKLYLLRDVTSQVEREEQRLRLQKAEEERKYLCQQQQLVRDLHDGLGGITANVGLLAARGLKAPETALKNSLLGSISQLALECGMEVRELMNSLETREMHWGDLFHDLQRYAALMLDPSSIQWRLEIIGVVPVSGLGPFAGLSLFRVFREAINNIAKHAQARSMEIRIEFSEDRCLIEVQDDGKGFVVDEFRPGRGLKNMRHRIQEMGGTFKMKTECGTRISCLIPLPISSYMAPGENPSAALPGGATEKE
jgi:PAS domain S-box-containing protein